MPAGEKGVVLLLHGLGRTGSSMAALAFALHGAGYRTLSPSYGARRTMAGIVQYLAPRVAAFQGDGPLHIVTHSLGGLVARALIHAARPSQLGRVVMLAPPLGGSELADLLCRWKLDAAILGPVGVHLATVRRGDSDALMGPVDYPLGIIAGDRPLGHVLPRSLLPRPHDGKVTVKATKIDGMADHLVLPVSHTLMVIDRQVIAQTLAFLADGAFRR